MTTNSALTERRDKILALAPTVKELMPAALQDQAERICRMASLAIANTPKLQECSVGSLVQACAQAASLGLDVGGVTGLAYMVPYRPRKGPMRAQLQVGYKGYIELAHRANIRVTARVVYKGDLFRVYMGTRDELLHEPKVYSGPFEDITHAYAFGVFPDKGHQFDVLDRKLIDRAQASSQASYDGRPWQKHYDEMARKTAVRRLAKYLPKSPELLAAALLDHRSDTGEPGGYSDIIDQVQELPPDHMLGFDGDVIDHDGDPRGDDGKLEEYMALVSEALAGAGNARVVNTILKDAVTQPFMNDDALKGITELCDDRKEELKNGS